MARSLEFVYGKNSFTCTIDKVDRSKLYGSVDIETTDREGNLCSLVTLAGDGKTLVPSGGTAFGYFNNDGDWVERDQLVPVDGSNNRLNPVGSSFKHPIELYLKVSNERFLDHGIRLSYVLEGEDEMPEEFMKELESGAIFKTTFSYRGGINPDPAFVILGQDDTVWFLVGNEQIIDFVGYEQTALSSEEEAEDQMDSDDLDFGMM